MDAKLWIALAGALIVFIGVLAFSWRARQLDAVHKNVIKSRVTLEQALRVRARAAEVLARSGLLDMASAVLLTDVVDEALGASGQPIVDDGLDALTPHDAGYTPSDHTPTIDRLAVESELSRVLRLTVDELRPEEIAAHYEPMLAELDQARNTVRLRRRFHNIHVTNARRIRRSRIAKIFHIHGHAPIPQPVDLDDE
ncbi:MAG: hypothetical protein WAO49_04695 [Arcanobacterium sp.]